MLIRQMTEADLPAAYKIHRLAFGTEFGLPDPMKFRGDSDVVAVRFGMYPDGCLVAESNGEVVGFGISNRWGSVGLLGPICVNPKFWNRGIGRELTTRNVAQFDAWGCTAAGLLTNPSSPRHLRLYQTFNFWPRHLTVVMARDAAGIDTTGTFESLAETSANKDDVIRDALGLVSEAFPGLDLSIEIRAVLTQQIGSVLFAYQDRVLQAFAICHHGPGSEGSSQALFVKFALVRRGSGSPECFDRLIRDCTAHAARNGLARVICGMSTSRHRAYRALLENGFRSEFQGVRMHRPLVDLLDTPDFYVVDDWR